MGKYDGSVSPEAQAAFLQQLQSQGGGSGEEMSPEQQQAAEQQGAQDAQADLAAAGADTSGAGTQQQAVQQPATPAPQQQQPDPNAQVLAQYGFSDINAMAQALQQATAANAQAQEQLVRITNIQKAMENANALDESNPQKAMLLQVLGPLLQETQDLTRGQMLRDAWQKDSSTMADLQQFMPEVQAHLNEHPELSVDPAGLRRAYDAVRSKNYRTEDQLLADPKFLAKLKGNKAFTDPVIAEYLNGVQRGQNLPQTIGAGGSTPMTGAKEKPKTMEDAMALFSKILGANPDE